MLKIHKTEPFKYLKLSSLPFASWKDNYPNRAIRGFFSFRFQAVTLKFKGISKRACCCSGLGSYSPHLSWAARDLLTAVPWATCRHCTASQGSNRRCANFETDPCRNVMNQEAGSLYLLFMQISDCSLSWRAWKEWVLKKNLLHCRAGF